MTRSFALLATVASVTASGTLVAQGAAPKASPVETAPQITVTGVTAVTSLANWPGLSLSVNKDAYVTVFAVTRTKGSALPIQILSPAKPDDAGKLRAGRTVKPRRLLGDEALHLLNYGESPLIVAIASSVKPELGAFKAGGSWGHDLLMDTLATSEQQMVEILAKTIYAAGVPFDAVISQPSEISPVPVVSGAFAFGNGPVVVSRYATSINGALVLATLDPIVMTADVFQKSGMIPMGYTSGAPFTLKGGSVAAIEKGRVVYYPRPPAPPTAAQLAGQARSGTPNIAPSNVSSTKGNPGQIVPDEL
ncbi:hypothetical protein [Gemmatimonas groenlandica]|uniref:DUF4384 domain-containing protein n=1 Tax=Gemmatimonas groenlandica TaxID=2732249 RepID=A0A6M4IL71_9BACT|nr:hypothetical protein [Gemmatimonas groenlandica]QJR34618.1 hypothetical protein HKW67_03335 [Gemmatimonas groenlandica]